MGKYKAIIFFSFLMIVYFLTRWMLIFGETGWMRWYFTDLLFVPAMCTFGLIGVRLIKRDPTIHIKWQNVFLQVLVVSFYFEWYLPGTDPKYTADPWDIVMYVLGGFAFLLIQKRL